MNEVFRDIREAVDSHNKCGLVNGVLTKALVNLATQVLNASEVMPNKKYKCNCAKLDCDICVTNQTIDKCTLVHTKLMLAKDEQISKLQADINKLYTETLAWSDIADKKHEENEKLRDIVNDLKDDDPCSFDHHGYCQTHGWFTTNKPCPQQRIKAQEAMGEK